MKLIAIHIKATILFIFLFVFQLTNSQENISDSEKNIEFYFSEAKLYKNQNNIKLTLEALNKALELAEKNENIKDLIDCYHKFSLLYLDIEKQQNSLYYWDRAELLLGDMRYPYGNAVHKYIDALNLFNNEKKFQAIYILSEAKQLSNDRNLLNHILLAEANIYMKIGKYDIASKNLNSLIVNNDIFEKEYIATQAYLGASELNFINNKLEECIKNAESALEMAKKNNFYKSRLKANYILKNTYTKINIFGKALEHSDNIIKLKDSIFTIEKTKNEAKNANTILFNSQNDEIKRLEEKVQELSEEANRSEITAILTSAFLTIISLLAVSLYRNNQIKLKTNDLLQTKNKELSIARDGAVQAMEAKTNFLSTVSHELRTPLYAVTGLTHLLLEENPSDNQKEHLKALKFSGDYLLNFINDILQINKIDAEKLEPLNVEFNLKKTLLEVNSSLSQSAKENNTKLVIDYDENIPSYLMSDALKLSQIFINLVGNAIKFTKDGEVSIIAKLKEKKDKNAVIYFEIKDNGIGISEEKQKNIFDSFEQGSIQINREYGGTGLGLTIVKSLLALFNTKIDVKSELGKGSSFFFELSLKYKEGTVKESKVINRDKEYNLNGLHILIVEDNKINQVITKKMLTKKEITSDIANNGYEAIDLAKENKYDAILMDIHMPGISGDQATIEIRKFNKEIPIIALTAISLDDSLEVFYAAGCNDVVTKPFKPEVFYQKIGENIFSPKINSSAS